MTDFVEEVFNRIRENSTVETRESNGYYKVGREGTPNPEKILYQEDENRIGVEKGNETVEIEQYEDHTIEIFGIDLSESIAERFGPSGVEATREGDSIYIDIPEEVDPVEYAEEFVGGWGSGKPDFALSSYSGESSQDSDNSDLSDWPYGS